MSKPTSKLSFLAFGIFLSACGGTSYKEQFTCNQVAAQSKCEVVKTNDESWAPQARNDCTSNAGTLSLDPCPRSDLLGICTLTQSDTEVDLYIYKSEIVMTTAGAKAGCDNIKGSFSNP
jgi:hypothetical protein